MFQDNSVNFADEAEYENRRAEIISQLMEVRDKMVDVFGSHSGRVRIVEELIADISLDINEKEEYDDEVPRYVRLRIFRESRGEALSVLNLESRVINTLRGGNIFTIEELMAHNREELLAIYNFGTKSLDRVIEALEEGGYSFPDDWIEES